MHCDKIIEKFNDLLDRSLSDREEHQIHAHLAVCPNCRDEFQLSKNADDLLRAAVLEMVAEIEVPSNLSQRIVQAMAGEKKQQTGKKKLFSLFMVPSFAAAMLLLVAVAGIFGYVKLFNPSYKNPAVVMSVPQSEPASGSAGGTESIPLSGAGQEQSSQKAGTTAEPQNNTESPMAVEKEPAAGSRTIAMQDTAAANAGSTTRQDAPITTTGNSFNTTGNGTAGSTQAAKEAEESMLMTSSQTPSDAKISISSGSAPPQGSLQEAALEVGFNPVVPGYLPPGAELEEVTWETETGTVHLGYRTADNKSFMFSQGQAARASVTGEKDGQLIDLNGSKSLLQETGSGGDPAPVYTTVRWQQSEYMFVVEGNIPREEILKIALSIK